MKLSTHLIKLLLKAIITTAVLPIQSLAQTTPALLSVPQDSVTLLMPATKYKHTFKVSEAGREKLVRIGPTSRPNTMWLNLGKDSLAVTYKVSPESNLN
ncbi:hypothetical protein [Nibribacter koreensis]|uniref:Uncharacterized protein n=1 Tax=Nibribacter koreensis TaxID=1084519 RepID=A0ABP8FTL3_9BACT